MRTRLLSIGLLGIVTFPLPAQTNPRAEHAEHPGASFTTTLGARHMSTMVDTLVELRPGDRVVLENLTGQISVGSWDRNELEIRGADDGVPIMVRRSGSTVRVVRDDRKGRRHALDVRIRMPASHDLRVSGSLDLWIEGLSGSIDVDNVSGDIWIADADGQVSVRTIEGEIDVVRSRGGVTASSQSDDVRLRDVRGPVDAHSGSGDVQLMEIVSARVRAETQDGDITFSGTIDDRGDYGFFVHDGDAEVAIPADANARVEVSTFDGEFISDFPVVLQRFTGGREFAFTVGAPRARITIQVFDGEIHLQRR